MFETFKTFFATGVGAVIRALLLLILAFIVAMLRRTAR